MSDQPSHSIPLLPFRVYYWTVIFLASLGLADAIYLSQSHYRVYTDVRYMSFCAISKAINCDTVSQSPYSILWGIPVPVWGIIGYAFVLTLLVYAGAQSAEKQRMWSILLIVTLFYSLFSIALGVISAYEIHSYCLMCIVSYAINFLLLYYAWLIRRRFASNGLIDDILLDVRYLKHQQKIPVLIMSAGFIIVITGLGTLMPPYWRMTLSPLSAAVSTGITDDGHPWIGAAHPLLEITEYSDYQCFQCKKMYYFLRRIIAENPDSIRLIHRHYPMDSKVNPLVKEPFHVGSAAMSLLAICAQSQGKFWEMNDILFNIDMSKGIMNPSELLSRVGIDAAGHSTNISDPHYMVQLLSDIRTGMKLGLSGTPGFVIDGHLYQGQIPAELLKKIMK